MISFPIPYCDANSVTGEREDVVQDPALMNCNLTGRLLNIVRVLSYRQVGIIAKEAAAIRGLKF